MFSLSTQVQNNSSVTGDPVPSTADNNADLFTKQTFKTFMTVFLVVYPLLGLTGIVSNCVNIYVFVKLGLTDITTVTLFSLSVADLGVTTFSTVAGLGYGFMQVQTEFRVWFFVHPFVVVAFATNTMGSIQGGSILLTAFLALQRCCCVALPFRFRQIFTKQFVVSVILGITAVTAFFVAAFASLYTMEWRRDAGLNYSLVHLAKRAHRDVLHHYLVLIRMFVMNIGCQVVVLVCLVFLLRGLRKSAGFRLKATRQAPLEKSTDTVRESDSTSRSKAKTGTGDINVNPDEKSSSGSEVEISGSVQSPQQLAELRLVKTVILLSTLFVVCNFPSIIHAILRLALPGFETFGPLRNSYKVSTNISDLLEILSANLNVFIYFKSNSRFRTTVMACFRLKPATHLHSDSTVHK